MRHFLGRYSMPLIDRDLPVCGVGPDLPSPAPVPPLSRLHEHDERHCSTSSATQDQDRIRETVSASY